MHLTPLSLQDVWLKTIFRRRVGGEQMENEQNPVSDSKFFSFAFYPHLSYTSFFEIKFVFNQS